MSIKFSICHDREGIEISTPDDVVTVDVPRAEEMVVELLNAITVAKNRKGPPAPSPLSMKDMGHEGDKTCDEFALVGDVRLSDTEYEPYFSVGGYELGIEDVDKLYEWLGKAIKYVRS